MQRARCMGYYFSDFAPYRESTYLRERIYERERDVCSMAATEYRAGAGELAPCVMYAGPL